MTPEEQPEEDQLDLETLATLTGLNRNHLRDMRLGKTLPSEHHVEELERVLPDEQVQLYTSHSTSALEYRTERYGHLPTGRVLLPYLPPERLQVGDLIAYRSPHRPNGTAWVRVDELEVRDDGMIKLVVGEAEMELRPKVPVRVARVRGAMSDGTQQ